MNIRELLLRFTEVCFNLSRMEQRENNNHCFHEKQFHQTLISREINCEYTKDLRERQNRFLIFDFFLKLIFLRKLTHAFDYVKVYVS